METNTKQPLTIWSFIGFILIIYGLVLVAAGIYYIFKPDVSIALYQLNPSLWWGGILFFAGLIFNLADLRYRRKAHV